LKLQDELASTENQILTARTRFNEAVKPSHQNVSKQHLRDYLDSKKKHISTLLKVQTNQLSKILNPPKSSKEG
jgi:hypothetical protein